MALKFYKDELIAKWVFTYMEEVYLKCICKTTEVILEIDMIIFLSDASD